MRDANDECKDKCSGTFETDLEKCKVRRENWRMNERKTDRIRPIGHDGKIDFFILLNVLNIMVPVFFILLQL